MKIWAGLILFAIGIGVGIAGPRYLPGDVTSYLPEGRQTTEHTIQWMVARKQQEQDRLLLTMTTAEGEALLATFTSNATDVDLLVDQGDTVTLRLRNYRPFVENPEILRVTKPVAATKEAESIASPLRLEEAPQQAERVNEPVDAPSPLEIPLDNK